MFEEEPIEASCGKRWTVTYEGAHYEGDSDGFNDLEYDCWEEAVSEYDSLCSYDPEHVWLTDNEYSVTLHNGDWS